jgi:uncharacterized protein (TIGR03435 family)
MFWANSNRSFSLALCTLFVVTIVCVARVQAQSPRPSDRPAFDVASIKPSNPSPGPNDRRAFALNGRFTATGLALTVLVSNAYRVQNYQISGGPKWIYYDRYDIVAKAEESVSTDTVLLMLQTLLEDRFKLTFHRETKELPVYVLRIGKDGPKLKTTAEDTPYSIRINRDKWTVSNLGMGGLAVQLSRELGRTVVDMTGLTGSYDFTLEWTRDQASPPVTDSPVVGPASPSLFTAVQEQLGLKLESRKQPIEMLIIDRAERPSEN